MVNKPMNERVHDYILEHKGEWMTTNEIGLAIGDTPQCVGRYIRGLDLEKKIKDHKRYYRYG